MNFILRYLIVAALAALTVQGPAFALGGDPALRQDRPLTALIKKPLAPTQEPELSRNWTSIKSAVILPYRSADVPADARGIITAFKFDKGDLVQKGQPVVEISKDRYTIMVEMARTKLEGLRESLKFAEQGLNFKKEVYSKHYGTRQKLLEAEADVSAIRHKVEEAKRELQLAKLNLQACVVRAPFTGFLVEKYKEAHEAVNQLDKLFRLVDTRKVFAVANVPEQLLPGFKKEASLLFTDAADRRFKGTIDKIEPILCPESKTAKVFLLIENPQAALMVGMTGALWPQ